MSFFLYIGTTSVVLIIGGLTAAATEIGEMNQFGGLIGWDFVTLVNSKISQLKLTVLMRTSENFGVTATVTSEFMTVNNENFGPTTSSFIPFYTYQSGYTTGFSFASPSASLFFQLSASAPLSNFLSVPANYRVLPIITMVFSGTSESSLSFSAVVTCLLSST